MPVWAAALLAVVGAWLTHTIAPAKSVACPPIAAYSADQQNALADAEEKLDPSSPLVGAMADYGALRKAARACSGAK